MAKTKSKGKKQDVWEKDNPKRKSTKMTAGQKDKAKKAAKSEGRSKPSLVDNINAMKGKQTKGSGGGKKKKKKK